MKRILTFGLFVTLFVILVIAIIDMPTMPTTDAPAYNDSIDYYLENALDETGATNIIAAILADYRGFDTLGETIVLFTSIVAVASVLRTTKKEKKEDNKDA